jgi:serine/threonine protein kinase
MSNSDRIGQQIGNYRLVRLLGCGGFACVYLGQHVTIRKKLAAIKILHAHVGERVQEEFQQEAEIIESLKHPHIICLLDFGTDKDNIPYLLMEYAAGGSLRDRHPRGTIVPLATVAEYVKQIAEALQYAHDHHVNHRDLKPENLLIGENGEILLSDFGIAAIVYDSPLIKTDEYPGTPSYMAPEHILGRPRRASDQYSLGIIVYEWLTGYPPFRGTVGEIISQHLSALPRPLREIVPTITTEVERIILKALAKKPEERLESVQVFADAFEKACKPPKNEPVKANLPVTVLNAIIELYVEPYKEAFSKETFKEAFSKETFKEAFSKETFKEAFSKETFKEMMEGFSFFFRPSWAVAEGPVTLVLVVLMAISTMSFFVLFIGLTIVLPILQVNPPGWVGWLLMLSLVLTAVVSVVFKIYWSKRAK